MSFSKIQGSILTLSLMAATGVVQAQQSFPQPTNGLLLEHGNVMGTRAARVELTTGSGYAEVGGGVRLGLPRSELILNSDLTGEGNEAVFKWGLNELEVGAPAPLQTAVYGGVSHEDFDDGQDFTNFVVGAAVTMEAAQYLLNFSPALISDDRSDDTILQLGLGAHLKLADTAVGQFRPGAEFVMLNGDEDVSFLALGSRWIYNERLTLDFVFITAGDRDFVGVPGFVRVSAAF